jgi:hypothetical protein
MHCVQVLASSEAVGFREANSLRWQYQLSVNLEEDTTFAYDVWPAAGEGMRRHHAALDQEKMSSSSQMSCFQLVASQATIASMSIRGRRVDSILG